MNRFRVNLIFLLCFWIFQSSNDVHAQRVELTPEESALIAKLIKDWPNYFNTSAPDYCSQCSVGAQWPIRVKTGSDGSCTINEPQAQYALARLISKYVPKGRYGTSREVGVAIYHVDQQGNVLQSLFEKNARVAQPVASTQKILAAYVAYKEGLMEDELAWKSVDWRADSWPPKHIYGEEIPVNTQVKMPVMIHTLLYESSNAAANAIARHYQQKTGKNFVQKMNEVAKSLIGEPAADFRSSFSDASGLQYNQYSTANNMARLLAKIESDREFMSRLKDINESIPMVEYLKILVKKRRKAGKLSEAKETEELIKSTPPEETMMFPGQLSWMWGGPDQFYKGGRLSVAGKTQIASVPVGACGGNTRIVIATFGQNVEGQGEKMFELNAEIRNIFERHNVRLEE